MINFPFYKFSPSGNTTVFLEGKPDDKKAVAHYCRVALTDEGIGGEQAGFVDIEEKRLRMGGGEFCANACRAFGALLDLYARDTDRRYVVHVSGMKEPVILDVQGKTPLWRVSAAFPVYAVPISIIDDQKTIASMQGISHLLIKEDNFPKDELIRKEAKKLCVRHKLINCPAVGITWWKESDGIPEILPFVQVLKSGTAMLENSCGSASIALAAMLKKPVLRVRQPSGEILEISRKKNQITLTGDVKLICAGQIWLPEYSVKNQGTAN